MNRALRKLEGSDMKPVGYDIIAVKKLLHRLESQLQCHVVLAGLAASRLIGLNNDSSDWDVCAVGVPTCTNFDEFDYRECVTEIYQGGIEYDLNLYVPFSSARDDINEWFSLDRRYPTILSGETNGLVHNDIPRSIIRVASRQMVFCDKEALSQNREIVEKGLSIRDQLDYDFSRAYMNFRQFLSGQEVRVRKYLYTLNELLSIRWGLKHGTFAPGFTELRLRFPMPEDITTLVDEMLVKNRNGTKQQLCPRNDIINAYIADTLNETAEMIAIFSKEYGDTPYAFCKKLYHI